MTLRLCSVRVLSAATAMVAAVALMVGAAGAATAGEGVDVSNWQHLNGVGIDWAQVRASGIDFAFVKATESTYYKNEWFTADSKAALANGIYRGTYHYARPALPLSTAVDQARYFVSVSGTLHGNHDLPPVLDMEEAGTLAPSDLIAWTKTWLQEVQRLTGRAPIIYTYPWFWQTAMANTASLTSYRLWLASYTTAPAPTTPLIGSWPTWAFWQHTYTGNVPGISGIVDMNRFCCDAGTLATLADGTTGSQAAGNPFGVLDTMWRTPGGVATAGWAIDPDTTGAVTVHQYVDGHVVQGNLANQPGQDVARVFPGFGDNHRFNTHVPVSATGAHTLCVWAINQQYGQGNPRLGCKTFTLATSPYGSFDAVARTPGGVLVHGWSIDPDTADSVDVQISVDGKAVQTTTASAVRGDVARVYPGYGNNHGFDVQIPTTSGGTHKVCVTALNKTGEGAATQLGCKTFTLTTSPYGSFDAVTPTTGGVLVHGWSIDPDTADSVDVQISVDGQAAKTVTASTVRGDVGRVYPAYGNNHGFDVQIPSTPGTHKVCVTALNKTGEGSATLLGCK